MKKTLYCVWRAGLWYTFLLADTEQGRQHFLNCWIYLNIVRNGNLMLMNPKLRSWCLVKGSVNRVLDSYQFNNVMKQVGLYLYREEWESRGGSTMSACLIDLAFVRRVIASPCTKILCIYCIRKYGSELRSQDL
jgi:hypothetical protein